VAKRTREISHPYQEVRSIPALYWAARKRHPEVGLSPVDLALLKALYTHRPDDGRELEQNPPDWLDDHAQADALARGNVLVWVTYRDLAWEVGASGHSLLARSIARCEAAEVLKPYRAPDRKQRAAHRQANAYELPRIRERWDRRTHPAEVAMNLSLPPGGTGTTIVPVRSHHETCPGPTVVPAQVPPRDQKVFAGGASPEGARAARPSVAKPKPAPRPNVAASAIADLLPAHVVNPARATALGPQGDAVRETVRAAQDRANKIAATRELLTQCTPGSHAHRAAVRALLAMGEKIEGDGAQARAAEPEGKTG
jgi:hypothetical protein